MTNLDLQDELRAERDNLLQEKAMWSTATGSGEVSADISALQTQWETEKSELIKARDEAKARVEVSVPEGSIRKYAHLHTGVE